jgi:DNA-binding CsgD family transcriptional regulator
MTKELHFHPLADIFPLMEGEEFEALVADIKANGLREQIVLYEGMILDGRNRYRALRALSVSPADIPGHPFGSFCGRDALPARDPGKDPTGFVVSRNVHRRHLTAKQKRDVIVKLIKAQPEKSDRQIAKIAKASPTTVGTTRAKLEAKGEVSKLDTRIDGKGVKQPAVKAAATTRQRAKLEPQLDAGAFHQLQTERQRNSDLTEQLHAAEIKIVGLESEIEDLKRENVKLRKQLEAAQKMGADGLDIPDFLLREAAS